MAWVTATILLVAATGWAFYVTTGTGALRVSAAYEGPRDAASMNELLYASVTSPGGNLCNEDSYGSYGSYGGCDSYCSSYGSYGSYGGCNSYCSSYGSYEDCAADCDAYTINSCSEPVHQLKYLHPTPGGASEIFEDLPPGPYAVKAFADLWWDAAASDGYEPNATGSATVVRGQTSEIFLTVREASATLSGRVVNAWNGEGIAGANIHLYDLFGYDYEGTTLGDGTFAIHGLPAGLSYTLYYQMFVEAEGFYSDYLSFPLGAEGLHLADPIVLEPITASGTLYLHAGWNLVSFPVIPEGATLRSTLWDHVDAIWAFTGTSYEEPDLDALLEPGIGYWVLAPEAVDVPLTGVPVELLEIELTAGWNLIGAPIGVSFIDPVPVTAEPAVWTWTGDRYVNSAGTPMLHGTKGYWILAFDTTILHLEGSA